jgi:translation elongation factor P/translation initiation factor 5A
MIAVERNIFRAIILLPLLSFGGCQSVKQDTYYEDKLTKERVLIVFSGSEKALVARYGQKFKYQYDPNDSPFVVFTDKRDYNPDSFSDLRIRSEELFLKSYSLIE